jgi:glycosyltransferase involved in cell wall biosynthesis
MKRVDAAVKNWGELVMLDKSQGRNTARGQQAAHCLAGSDGILCFGAEDWWYHNRGYPDMQIMQCIARKLPVLYVNSVGFRMPSPQEGAQFLYRVGRKLRSVARPISSPLPGFHVGSPFSVPLWHRPFLRRLNILSLEIQIRKACRVVGLTRPLLWVACPTAFEVAKRMQRSSVVVYQRHDKFEEYNEQTREYMMAADQWLSEHAALIVYSSRVLYEEERGRKPQSLLIGQGVELAHFDPDKARQAGQPFDLANIKRPIVGFFGEIEENGVDMALVGEVVQALPEVSFVFVGRLIADPAPVRGLPNIHFLGKKPYDEVPRYGAHFDLAIMPLPKNQWKYYSSPLKLKEYLALGLPIVSTEFPEAIYYKDIFYVASNGADFIHGIREALQGRAVGTPESRRARVAGDTWEQATLRVTETIRKLAGQNLGCWYVADREKIVAIPRGS